MTRNERWVVTTSSDRPITDIAKDLSDSGFDVGETLEEIGIIIGTADDSLVDRLRSIAGVIDASPESPIDIGPPDSPETW